MTVDLNELTRRWQQSWPRCPPIAYLFTRHLSDTWVRFHSLPESQRYATNEAEYQIVLHRHNTILRELGASECYLVTATYGTDDLASGTEPVLHPNASRWMRVVDPDEPAIAHDLHVSRLRYEPGRLDRLLRCAADDQVGNVFVADTALRWLFHPYDGGADVILPSGAERDRLKARYREWLSARSDGY